MLIGDYVRFRTDPSYYEMKLYRGVAALPSLHVAVLALFAMGTWRWRALSIVLWVLTAVTFVGSMALAWHYAVDGYLGVALAYACWWMRVGLRRERSRRSPRRRARERTALRPRPRLQSRLRPRPGVSADRGETARDARRPRAPRPRDCGPSTRTPSRIDSPSTTRSRWSEPVHPTLGGLPALFTMPTWPRSSIARIVLATYSLTHAVSASSRAVPRDDVLLPRPSSRSPTWSCVDWSGARSPSCRAPLRGAPDPRRPVAGVANRTELIGALLALLCLCWSCDGTKAAMRTATPQTLRPRPQPAGRRLSSRPCIVSPGPRIFS
jgi:hypothetical protein